MTIPIENQRVVITGASSGIGRAAALEFARRGAWVTLASRNREALEETARECEAAGGRAQVVITDVGRWEEVSRLAEEAFSWGGRIDTWVNNAAVSAYGTVEELSIEEMERIIQVDLMGQIYGVKAVLPYMRHQAEGTIINVASVVGERSMPLQAPYCAAKHGVKGFTETLRMELDYEKSGIRVTLIKPGSINTPFFNHARSKMGFKPSPPPPVYEPELVAEAIVHAAEHEVRDVFVGGAAKLMATMEHLAPQAMDDYMVQSGRMFRQQKSDEFAGERDSLFEASEGPGRVHGDYGNGAHRSSPYTLAFELHPERKRWVLAGLAGLAGLALVGAAAGVASTARSFRSRRAEREEEQLLLVGTVGSRADIQEMDEMAIEGEPFFYW